MELEPKFHLCPAQALFFQVHDGLGCLSGWDNPRKECHEKSANMNQFQTYSIILVKVLDLVLETIPVPGLGPGRQGGFVSCRTFVHAAWMCSENRVKSVPPFSLMSEGGFSFPLKLNETK